MDVKAKRLQAHEDEMTLANEEYIQAVNRASQSIVRFSTNATKISLIEDLHSQVSDVLRMMLGESDADILVGKQNAPGPGG
jgi:mediator of RNA polymerase II transcription subunit 21